MYCECGVSSDNLLVDVCLDFCLEDWILHVSHEAEVLPLASLQMKLQLEGKLSSIVFLVHGMRQLLVNKFFRGVGRQSLIHAPAKSKKVNFGWICSMFGNPSFLVKFAYFSIERKSLLTLEVPTRPPRRH